MIASHQFDVEHLFSHGDSQAFFHLVCLGRIVLNHFPVPERGHRLLISPLARDIYLRRARGQAGVDMGQDDWHGTMTYLLTQ